MDAETQKQIDELRTEIQRLKRPLVPFDTAVQKAISDSIQYLLPAQIMDIFWRKLTYWKTFFESNTGYNNAGTVSTNGTRISITTAAATGSPAYITKTPADNAVYKYSQPIFIRTAFESPAATGYTAYMVFGRSIATTGESFFGFKITNGTLYGVSSNDGTDNEVTVSLGTISASTPYQIEARYYPENKIVFFVDPTLTDPGAKGVLTTGLPIPSESIETNLMCAVINSDDASAQTIQLGFFEILAASNLIN